MISSSNNRTSSLRTNRTVRFTGNIFANQRYGGVSRYVVELVSQLDRDSDWSASITAPLHINEYLRSAKFSNPHRGIYLGYRPSGLRSINRVLERIGRVTRRDRFAVTHEVLYGSENLRHAKGLKISTFYDMIHERFMPNEELSREKQLTLQESDHVIAISEATKADIVKFFDVDPSRIDVIYLASNMQRNPDRITTLPPEDYVLWVGPRRGYKNFDTFSRALVNSRVWANGYRLVCAGGPPPQREEIDAWQQVGLSHARVTHLQPNESELASLYSHAALLVYASKFEGFGIPPLEAMNCGCPVAASSSGSIPEVVGTAALSFDPNSSEAITDSIDRVCESPTLQSELVSRGNQQARQFSWQRCAHETSSMYSRLIDERLPKDR